MKKNCFKSKTHIIGIAKLHYVKSNSVNRAVNIDYKCTGLVIRELCITRHGYNTYIFGRAKLVHLICYICSNVCLICTELNYIMCLSKKIALYEMSVFLEKKNESTTHLCKIIHI